MSIELDNKLFVSGVCFPVGNIGNGGNGGSNQIDFNKSIFGIWVSVFENVNNGFGGYSLPQPLIEDIVGSPFTITGKTFSALNFDGKKADIKFFLTSGVKGINGYESLTPVADITNSYILASSPQIIMPDMDFPGKIYRRTEVLGTQKSFLSKNDINVISGEDWQDRKSTRLNSSHT